MDVGMGTNCFGHRSDCIEVLCSLLCCQKDVIMLDVAKKERGKDALALFNMLVKLSCASQKDEVLAESCG